MILDPPPERTPYVVVAHGDSTVPQLTSAQAIDEVLDRSDARRREISDPDEDHWLVSVGPRVPADRSRDDIFDTPVMEIDVGCDRVPVHHDHELAGRNAMARSERRAGRPVPPPHPMPCSDCTLSTAP